MGGNKILAGCLGMVGLSFIGLAISMALTGPLDGAICAGVLGLGPTLFALSIIRAAQAGEKAKAERLQEQRERQILAVAARHEGRVTPALVAMHSVDFTIATAKAILDQLASAGLCAAEADEDGNLYYAFDLTAHPRAEQSPEEWVASRMTDSSGRTDLDALDDAD